MPKIYKAQRLPNGDIQLTHEDELLTIEFQYEEDLNGIILLNGLYYIKWSQ